MAKPKGNVYQISATSWRVKYPLGRDPATGTHRNIQETHPSEDAAWDRLMRIRIEVADGNLVAPSKITVQQFSSRWIDAKRATVRGSTIGFYQSMLKALLPRLGHVPLVKLDAPMILDWQAELNSRLSPTTVRHYHRGLKTMLADAVRWGYLSRNAADGVTPPPKSRPPLRVWSRPQIDQFLRHIEARDDEALWRLMITTGIRVGEVCALTWSDLFGDTLTIRHTQAYAEDGSRTINEPKSPSGSRMIILSQLTVAALKGERQRQRDILDTRGTWWNVDGWMFPSPRGGMVTTASVRDRFKRLCRDAGLPYIGPHGLRHSYGTDMMRAGVAPRVVQERMGHSSVTITLDLYSHPDSDMHRSVADTIERDTGDGEIVHESLRNYLNR